MKFLLYYSLAVILNCANLFAQPDTLWSYATEVTSGSKYFGATQLANGSFALVGAAEISSGPQQKDLLVSKISSNGSEEWTRTLNVGMEQDNEAWAAVELPNGDLSIVGWGNNRRAINVVNISAGGTVGESWEYPSSGLTRATHAILARDSSVMICGYHYAGFENGSDFRLLKKSAFGDTTWTRQYGDTATDICWRIREAESGGFFLAGQTASYGLGGSDFWLVRTNANGTQRWHRTFGTSSVEVCYDLVSHPSDALYLVGRRQTAGATTGYIVKADTSGNEVWSGAYTSGGADTRIHGAAHSVDGGLLCAGWSGGSETSHQCWLLRVGAAGDTLWSYASGPENSSGYYGIIAAAGGGFLAYGYTTLGEVERAFAVRIEAGDGIRGTVMGESTEEPAGSVYVHALGTPYRVRTGDDGRFALELDPGIYDIELSGPCVETDTVFGIAAFADSIAEYLFTIGQPDLGPMPTSFNLIGHNDTESSYVVRIENGGTGVMNFECIVETLHPEGNWLTAVPSSGTILPQEFEEVELHLTPDTTNNGVFEFEGLFRLRSNSCPDSHLAIPVFLTVLDAEERAIVVNEFALHPAFPNPFNNSTTIRFDLASASPTKLSVFDVQGREAAVLVDEVRETGTHAVRFDAEGFSSGIYFFKLEAGNHHAVNKVVMIK